MKNKLKFLQTLCDYFYIDTRSDSNIKVYAEKSPMSTSVTHSSGLPIAFNLKVHSTHKNMSTNRSQIPISASRMSVDYRQFAKWLFVHDLIKLNQGN